MAEKLGGGGKIGVIYHDADFFCNTKEQKHKKTIEENYPNIQIIERTGISAPTEGEKAAASMLSKHQDLKEIYVVWDVPAEGALNAARNQIKL